MYDAFYPRSYGLYRNPQAINVDACLGTALHSEYYHYYSFSPCIFDSDIKRAREAVLCNNNAVCKKNVTEYIKEAVLNDLSLHT